VVTPERSCRPPIAGEDLIGVVKALGEMTMRKHVLATATFVALAASSCGSTAWAEWGCGARSPEAWGNSFGGATREAAERAALEICGHESCKIVGCSPEATTRDQARALWPIPTAPTRCSGSGCEKQ
jgi:hypothetical protein